MCSASSCAVRNTRMAISCGVEMAEPVSKRCMRLLREMGTHATVSDEDLREWARMTGCLPAHGLDGVHRRAGCAGRPGEDGGQAGRVESLGRVLRDGHRVGCLARWRGRWRQEGRREWGGRLGLEGRTRRSSDFILDASRPLSRSASVARRHNVHGSGRRYSGWPRISAASVPAQKAPGRE